MKYKDFEIREATPADLKTVMYHRRSMFRDMGYREESDLHAMEKTSEPFFAERLARGTYRGWLVETTEKQVIAGGGIIIFDYHSSPSDPLPKRPVIVNMYTEPEYRRTGIARMLMQIMIDWCEKEGFASVVLNASAEGKPLYESLGFKPTNEMRLKLR